MGLSDGHGSCHALHGDDTVAFSRVKQSEADGMGATLERIVRMIVGQMPSAWSEWSADVREGVSKEGARLRKQRCTSAPRARGCAELPEGGGGAGGGATAATSRRKAQRCVSAPRVRDGAGQAQGVAGRKDAAAAAKRKAKRCASAPRARASADRGAPPLPAVRTPAQKSSVSARPPRKSRPLSAPPDRVPLGPVQGTTAAVVPVPAHGNLTLGLGL